MDDSPVNYSLNGSKNAIPTGSEYARCLLPTQPFRPRGQKESIRERLLIVAAGPKPFCFSTRLRIVFRCILMPEVGVMKSS